MKVISYLILGLIVTSCSLKPILKGSFVDKRDGHEYKWIKLKNQIWMAQNLDFVSKKSWYYNDDSTNHKIYGRFYLCDIAKEVCPVGWHLPSDDDWKTLEIAAGMNSSEANMIGWRGDVSNIFMNEGHSGFNVQFIGMRRQGYFAGFGEEAQFWSSTQINKPTITRSFRYGDNRISANSLGAAYGCSVRCVKNDTTTNDLTVFVKNKN